MKKINKLWVMEGGFYGRDFCFQHIRIKANIEGLKTTKILYQIEYPIFEKNDNAKEFYINLEQLENILGGYEYNLDLKILVNKFNALVDKVWEENK